MRHINKYQDDAAIQAALDEDSLGKPYVALRVDDGTIDWNEKDKFRALKFSTDAETTFDFNTGLTLEYSLDDGATWNAVNGRYVSYGGSLGDLLIRGTNASINKSFNVGGSEGHLVYCSGNVMWLLDHTQDLLAISKMNCFRSLFDGCTYLATAPELPATRLSSNCYSSMFHDCVSLTAAPELPATTMNMRCYLNMFDGCTSLVEAPELPATTLDTQCYEYMFQNCSSLVEAPELPAETLKSWCYFGMFNYCSNLSHVKSHATNISPDSCLLSWLNNVPQTGTIEIPASMVSVYPRGKDGIPSGWTVETF